MKLTTCLFWIGLVLLAAISFAFQASAAETSSGWEKYDGNPVLGGDLGTCFDITVIEEENIFKMWFSWRPKAAIAYTESTDGIHWSDPEVVLAHAKNDWEDDLNRPGVLRKDGLYHMWYTGQANGGSKIGYATSKDGRVWQRQSAKPVMVPELPWEKVAVMCPHVEWDEAESLYKMWYSAGEQYEPNSLGYATSPDGLVWTKHPDNPIFVPDKNSNWEKHKVTAAQICKKGDWYYMFYIGFEDENTARIGIARSRDGITNWQRHPGNPIVSPGQDKWDASACYKPYAIYDAKDDIWRLWYNGRNGGWEQIGLVYHEGEDLGFPDGNATDDEQESEPVLKKDDYRPVIEGFNQQDNELYRQFCPNDEAWDFLSRNIPFLDYPDEQVMRTYYFRWWTFRKHVRLTKENGFVLTEFLPNVPWSGKENTIPCAAGHHFREGRWLRNQEYLNDYAHFWFGGGGNPRNYSFWPADSLWQQALVTGDFSLATGLLSQLTENEKEWENNRLDPNGLFWQNDGEDGMEVSIGGSGYRVTINSYLYGEDRAIARLALRSGNDALAQTYFAKADERRKRMNQTLWDSKAEFYKVAPRTRAASDPISLVEVREQHGYTPWYFDAEIPEPEFRIAWNQLADPKGFFAPFGPTTAEQRSPDFKLSYEGHECQWNGPSWPYSTSITLTGLANEINRERLDGDGTNADALRKIWLDTFACYTHSHERTLDDGTRIPWIDENLNPLTGDWLSRSRLSTWNNGTWDAGKGGPERGKDYNHSTYCDLVITGLIGLRPLPGNSLAVCPLADRDVPYFCLDQIPYHGRSVTILYDSTGTRYHRGKGFQVLVDGQLAFRQPLLPETVCEIGLPK